MLSFYSYAAFANASLICKCLHGQAPQTLCDMVQPLQAWCPLEILLQEIVRYRTEKRPFVRPPSQLREPRHGIAAH